MLGTSTPPSSGQAARTPDRETISASFREVMASLATPVSIVTAFDETRPHGTTVSAFASLSLDPVMALVSLARSSMLLPLLHSGSRMGINLLSSAQGSLAQKFATKDRDRFRSVPWRTEGGVPVLDGVIGWLACDVVGLVPGGDHVIVLGHVTIAQGHAQAPLTYRQHRFGTHLDLD
jgi:flavin reductase (DIM6/NTAB) family NADH-FMN oxidoreductase RutF